MVVIVGPTGVGKTKLSIALAHYLDGEIINADSTQVYKGMDIATAKVTEEEKENIPHHLLDIKTMEEEYTVYDYQKDCRRKIEEIQSRGKVPILVGGTGLYIKATLYNYEFSIQTNSDTFEEVETTVLFKKLKEIDANTNIHPNNRKRIIRALNYYEETKKIPSQKGKSRTLLYPCCIIGLTMDRAILYERINKRVDQMLEDGLLEEAKRIFDTKICSKAVMTPIGYKELFPYFEHQKSLEEAVEEIKQHSRRYAKRQYTWFNNQMPVHWITVDLEHFDHTIAEAISLIQKN